MGHVVGKASEALRRRKVESTDRPNRKRWLKARTRGEEVPRVQLYGCSGHQAHDCAEIPGAVQAANPGDHAKGQGRQHQDDNGRTGPVYAGLVRLFRLLRNARGVDRSHSLGPAAIAGRSVASVENTTSPSCGTDRTAS